MRLQWDPGASLTCTSQLTPAADIGADHDPSGEPVLRRRAIQLGLKNVGSFANGDDILRIDDLTEFVAGCDRSDLTKLVTPKYMSGVLPNTNETTHQLVYRREVIYTPKGSAATNVGLSSETRVSFD